jgi:hypothetical protein
MDLPDFNQEEMKSTSSSNNEEIEKEDELERNR